MPSFTHEYPLYALTLLIRLLVHRKSGLPRFLNARYSWESSLTNAGIHFADSFSHQSSGRCSNLAKYFARAMDSFSVHSLTWNCRKPFCTRTFILLMVVSHSSPSYHIEPIIVRGILLWHTSMLVKLASETGKASNPNNKDGLTTASNSFSRNFIDIFRSVNMWAF